VVDVVRTPRLLLRRWAPADSGPLAAINADPEVMRHIAAGAPLTRAQSDGLLARFELGWATQGYGLWAVEEQASPGRLVGFCGLAVPTFLPTVLPAVEVGWRLARHAWGRGIATEATRTALDHGFGRCGMAEIISIIDPGNRRSLRVAEKLGMTPRPDRIHPGTRRRVRVLGLTAAQARDRTG
jgi:RimJ/RimL family protein N-acetyltransferase